MPSRVTFKDESEYMSTFNKSNKEIAKLIGSPILKPRFESSVAFNKVREKQGDPDAGLRSVDSHITREPPLQHKHIVEYKGNHNTSKTYTTEWLEKDNNLSNRFIKEHPILAYEKNLEKPKFDNAECIKQENQENMKDEDSYMLYNKYAGKESNNLRYRALEPPMQRKRRSPYKLNHNILKTNTVQYINGNESDSNDTKEDFPVTKFPLDMKLIDNVEKRQKTTDRKEENLNVGNKAFEALQPSKMQVVNDENSNTSTVQAHGHNVEGKKAISPLKIQRRNDLQEVKIKQSERVERALKIKAGLKGIEPPLHSHPIRSEYQRQFQWKEPIIQKWSGIQSNDNNKLNINTNNDTFKKIKMPRKIRTEYQHNFKKFDFPKNSVMEENMIYETVHKNDKIINDKSQQDEEIENSTKSKSIDKRLLQPSQSSYPLQLPNLGYNDWRTEYRTNFQSPKKFNMKNGAWQNAMPPHLYPSSLMENKGDQSDWFEEVLKLRKLAEQYKERARETHYATKLPFSRTVDQNMLNHADSIVSVRENLNLSAPEAMRNTWVSEGDYRKDAIVSITEEEQDQFDLKKGKQVNTEQESRDEEKFAAPSCTEVGKSTSTGKRLDFDMTSNNENGGAVNDDSSVISMDNDNDAAMNVMKGRVETARLAASREHRRHNLDRTTPLGLGTIAKVGERFSSMISAPLHQFRDYKPDRSINKSISASECQEKQIRDNQVAFIKRPSHYKGTMNIDSTSKKEQRKYNHDKYEDKKNIDDFELTDLEFSPVIDRQQYLATENLEKPPKAIVQPVRLSRSFLDNDEDVLSEVSMSARDWKISDVLERSRMRRDNFW